MGQQLANGLVLEGYIVNEVTLGWHPIPNGVLQSHFSFMFV